MDQQFIGGQVALRLLAKLMEVAKDEGAQLLWGARQVGEDEGVGRVHGDGEVVGRDGGGDGDVFTAGALQGFGVLEVAGDALAGVAVAEGGTGGADELGGAGEAVGRAGVASVALEVLSGVAVAVGRY